MKLIEKFNGMSQEEITNELMLLDKCLMELHEHNYFVVSDLSDIDIIDGDITLNSFKDKIDYLNSGFNTNGDKQDILELCGIGISAYNHFPHLYTTKEFISYVIDNLDMFLENGSIPKMLQEYYIDVFARGKVDYLNNFALNYENKAGHDRNKAHVLTKSTAVGRALSEKNDEAAYTNILLIPGILVLVSMIVLLVYFMFFN